MRALVFERTFRFDPRRPEPDPSNGDTVVDISLAAVSRLDVLAAGSGLSHAVPGHEFVGRVAASPDRSLRGRRVVGPIVIPCGKCRSCTSGLSVHCPSRRIPGQQGQQGAFAERIRIPSTCLHEVPPRLTDEQAVFAYSVGCALTVRRLFRFELTTWATVLGDGPIGLLVAQILRSSGVPVRLIGKHARNVALCEKWGVRSRMLSDTRPRGDQDVVIDCTGRPGGLDLAMSFTRARGTVLAMSMAADAGARFATALVGGEITVIGVRFGSVREGLRAIADRVVDVESLVERRIRLEDGVDAVQLVESGGKLKILLTMR